MALRRADTAVTRRFTRGEDLGSGYVKREADDAWVELRTRLTKEEDAAINDSAGFERIQTTEGIVLRGKALSGDRKVFELLAVGWDYASGTPKVEDYLALDAGDADWVDECLRKAVEIARGDAEGKDSSPATTDPLNSGPISSVAEGEQQPTG